jgi:hypothetical protein
MPSPVARMNVSEANFPVSGLPLSEGPLANRLTDTRTRRRRAPTAYFFAAFGLALARFSFRTDGRVARGLTGALAR